MPQPKLYTIEEVLSMDVSKLCNGWRWRLEVAKHGAACRNEGIPYRESEVAKSVTPHLIALDKKLIPKKLEADQQQGQQELNHGRSRNPQQAQQQQQG